MKELICDTMKSVKGKMSMQKHTFELLGYDFIIDEQQNTVLIEVNTNPCLEESNSLLKQLLPRMIDDLMNVVMDPLFGPYAMGQYGQIASNQPKYESKFPLKGDIFGEGTAHPGYPDTTNLWQHLFTFEQQ